MPFLSVTHTHTHRHTHTQSFILFLSHVEGRRCVWESIKHEAVRGELEKMNVQDGWTHTHTHTHTPTRGSHGGDQDTSENIQNCACTKTS